MRRLSAARDSDAQRGVQAAGRRFIAASRAWNGGLEIMTFSEWWDGLETREQARMSKADVIAIWAAAAHACAEACEAVDVETIVGAHDAYLEGRAVAVRRCARAARMISNLNSTTRDVA